MRSSSGRLNAVETDMLLVLCRQEDQHLHGQLPFRHGRRVAWPMGYLLAVASARESGMLARVRASALAWHIRRGTCNAHLPHSAYHCFCAPSHVIRSFASALSRCPHSSASIPASVSAVQTRLPWPSLPPSAPHHAAILPMRHPPVSADDGRLVVKSRLVFLMAAFAVPCTVRPGDLTQEAPEWWSCAWTTRPRMRLCFHARSGAVVAAAPGERAGEDAEDGKGPALKWATAHATPGQGTSMVRRRTRGMRCWRRRWPAAADEGGLVVPSSTVS